LIVGDAPDSADRLRIHLRSLPELQDSVRAVAEKLLPPRSSRMLGIGRNPDIPSVGLS
jgi:hypothetical protein